MTAIEPGFVHDHMGGRFTATHGQEATAIGAILDLTDLLTTTEIDAPDRSRCLLDPRFHTVFGNKGPRDDCGIAVRKSRFDLLEGGTRELSPLTYQTESHGQSSPTVGAYAVVKDVRLTKSVGTGVVVVVHMPHGMQDALRTGQIGDDVARAYRDILDGARRLANRLARNYHADWTIIVGDWNLDIKHVWVQLYLRARFPSFRVNFAKPYPARGTFGKGIICLAMLRGIKPQREPLLLTKRPGFDHVGWREVLG